MRYLFTTQATNDLGLLARSVPVAVELMQRGHRVAFCNPMAAPRKLIAEAGLENLLPKHPIYFLNDLQARGEATPGGLYRAVRGGCFERDFGSLGGFLRQLLRAIPMPVGSFSAELWSTDQLMGIVGRSEGYLRTEIEALARLIEEWGADAVVDSFNPLACIAARVARRPLVTLIQADMHPLGRGFIWWREPPAGLPTPVPTLNRILSGYGLPSIRKTEDLFAADLTLVMGMPETDPLPAEANVTYVGAILWQKPDAVLPQWVEDLPKDQPLVWVYSGNPRYASFIASPVDSEVVLRACVAALAGEPVQVILTTGHHPLPRGLLPLPDNFHHAPYLPGMALAERSQLLIHHGGYGSCQTGLLTGVPAVIIPTYSERESNARRVAAVGAGEMVLPTSGGLGRRKTLDVDALRAAVRRVLANPAYTANARRVSEKLGGYGGAAEAAKRIEDFSTG